MQKNSLAILSILVLGTSSAYAATTTYTSQADFLNDLTQPAITVDFESFSSGDIIPNGASAGGATVTYDLGGAQLMVDDFYDTTSPNNYLGTDDPFSDYSLYGGDSVTVTFDSAMYAFGLYVISGDTIYDDDFTITTNSGQSASSSSVFDVALLDGEAYYLGLIEDDYTQGFTSVTFSSYPEDYVFNIDDITVSAVPEPSTYLLFSLGLLGVVGMSRRRLRYS